MVVILQAMTHRYFIFPPISYLIISNTPAICVNEVSETIFIINHRTEIIYLLYFVSCFNFFYIGILIIRCPIFLKE